MSKAGGLYDDVLEGEFAGPKIKHIFVYLNFFWGGWEKNLFKGGSEDPFYNWTPHFLGRGWGHNLRVPNLQKTLKIYISTDDPLKEPNNLYCPILKDMVS